MNNTSRRDYTEILLHCFTWIFRILVGSTFIFSGFVKAVDPWGTFYKFQEYVSALGWHTLSSILITGVFALCALEFILGICILLGCYRRSSPIIALLIMCMMLPLTLWIAISNPVSDCGCFGDFVVISNWSTFWKNILLTGMILWLVKFNKSAICIISPAFQWIGAVISAIFILIVSFTGYHIQPLLDFRAYEIGTTLLGTKDAETSDEADDYIFVYKKDGQEREFGINDELPSEEDGWEFVDRRKDAPQAEVKARNRDSESGKTFRIWNMQGDTDVTEETIDSEGGMLLLMIPDLSGVSPATTWKINELYEWASRKDIEMIAVVSGTAEEITEWSDLSMPEYPIYTSDDTAIKEVARGNPATVLLKDGLVIWKSTLNALNIELLDDKDEKITSMLLITDSVRMMRNLLYIYLICMVFPIVLTMMPRLRGVYRAMRR